MDRSIDDVLGISHLFDFLLVKDHLLLGSFSFLLLVNKLLGFDDFAVRKEEHAKFEENLRWVLTLVEI